MKNKIISGQVIPINQANIDTDAIIPKQYLKSINKSGFGKFLFDSLRYSRPGTLDDYEDRELNMDFVLNKEPFSKGKILIANDNFGCGSSREHAVWALRDFGIKAVIASSFGDIFYNNCFKNRVLPIQLKKNQIEELFKTVQDEIVEFSIDLQERIITNGDKEISFDVEDHLIDRIIYGLDDVDITLKVKDQIHNFEKNRKETRPWVFINE